MDSGDTVSVDIFTLLNFGAAVGSVLVQLIFFVL